ncbi:zinc finger CCCH domain-containing protein 19 [Tanacetum coccineum]
MSRPSSLTLITTPPSSIHLIHQSRFEHLVRVWDVVIVNIITNDDDGGGDEMTMMVLMVVAVVIRIPPPNYTEQEIKQWRESRKKNYPARVTELKMLKTYLLKSVCKRVERRVTSRNGRVRFTSSLLSNESLSSQKSDRAKVLLPCEHQGQFSPALSKAVKTMKKGKKVVLTVEPGTDIWSIGCILAEPLTGKTLFHGRSVVHQLDLITDLLGTLSADTIDWLQEEGEINDKKEQMGYEMNAPGKSVDSFEEGEIIGESDDGCVKDCMGKKLDDDVEKDIEDCSNNVTEKCGVVNNNMSNNVEGEILEDHFDGDRGNDTIEDNADVNPSTNVSLEVNIPEVANDSSIVSPSTPPGNDLNIAKESCSTWLDYVGPLITDELDSEKRWSYRDPKGNIQGSFSLAQLHMWKDYFPSDLQIWSYYGNVKETILLHNALKRRTKNAG